MTVYVFDDQARGVLATWPAGIGSRAQMVAELPGSVADAVGLRLCEELTRLSAAAWDTYINPASAVEDPADRDQERWRRDQQRAAFGGVVEPIRTPNLPMSSGVLIVSYDPVEEAAHRLGRVLHDINDQELTEAVVVEAQRELDAVHSAESGELTGRAVQAVVLDRVDASPLQVLAADELLSAHPLGTEQLLTSVDPAAASVAAAHWLVAAATVAGQSAGREPWEVFAESDDIQACSIEVPALVVEQVIEGQRTPREVVLGLLADAAIVRRGGVPDPDAIAEQIEGLDRLAEHFPDGEGEGLTARTTPLDPLRPARDLLEHLLDGLGSSQLLYLDTANDPDDNADLIEDDDEQPESVEEPDDTTQLEEQFRDAVRVEARRTHPRLS